MRFLPRPGDSATQLVELGQSEAFGVLDHHQRGVGHIHADLDHRGGDQQLDIPALKAAMVAAVACVEAAVHQPL